MTDETFYINPASSAGGDGTTSGVSGATRAYSSLVEWDADAAHDLITDTTTHYVETVAGTDTGDGTNSVNTTVDTSWSACNATYNITMRPYSTTNYHNGNHDGTEGYVAKVLATDANTPTLKITGVTYFTVEDVSFWNEHTDATANALWADGQNCTARRCIIRSSNDSWHNFHGTQNTIQVEACLIFPLNAHDSTGIQVGGGTVASINNTMIECRRGMRVGSSQSGSSKNSASINPGDFNFVNQGTMTGSYNASDDSTHNAGSMTNGFAITEAAFEDYVNEDFHPKSGGALDGTGLLANAPADNLTLDRKQFADPPSVGCFEVLESTGVTVPQIMAMKRKSHMPLLGM